ncbi:MAG: hypothetical protein RL722_2610 [Pseudomonadota bacterium]|jgi:ABC-type uncharacterized transport system permease subunit
MTMSQTTQRLPSGWRTLLKCPPLAATSAAAVWASAYTS